MKLKYYLRGLGIGMAVTALILGITFAVSNKKNTMTDAEIIARAKQLGMTERTVLSETQPKEETQKSEETQEQEKTQETEVSEEENEEPEQVTESEPETLEEPEEPVAEEAEPEVVEEETEAEPEVVEEETEAEPEAVEEEKLQELVVIEIVRGDSSDSVSKKLADMGLVESAPEYDKYLCTNGYDKKIQTGTYEIQKGATQEEIARIITRS